MRLRRIAIPTAVLAAIGAYLGQLPGRAATKDDANCLWRGALDYFRTDELCAAQYVQYTKPAVAFEVVVVLAVAALGAAIVALVPKRVVAGGWIATSAIASVIAFVLTRSMEVRWREYIDLWPRYATWSIAALVAATMLSVLVWLFATDP